MAPKLSHPFLEGLKDIPDGKKKDLHKIKSWMNTQAHLPQISDEYVYLFLHACYYSHEKTKSAIDSYFTIRANHPSIFADRDAYSPRMQTVLDLGIINTQRDQAHRRRSLDEERRTIPRDGLGPRMFSRNLSSVCRNPYQARLVPLVFARNSSTFHIHPEKLKQIMKERDGQSLCHYYDSDSYKMKAVDFVEEQSRVINEIMPQNVQEDIDVTYEHMLNCAQPRQKPKVFIVQDNKEQDLLKMPKTKKSLLADLLIRAKTAEEVSSPVVDKHSPARKTKVKGSKKRYRKRTTILPLYLKKMQGSPPVKDKISEYANVSLSNEDFSTEDKTDNKAELLSTNIPFPITKSEYKVENEEKAQRAQRLLREKVLNVDYENEIVSRIRPQSKYTVGSEEERHWYQNPNAPRKLENRITDIKEFGPGGKTK